MAQDIWGCGLHRAVHICDLADELSGIRIGPVNVLGCDEGGSLSIQGKALI